MEVIRDADAHEELARIARSKAVASDDQDLARRLAPDAAWDVSAQWDLDAERVHGISRWDLRSGIGARDAMTALNNWVGDVDVVWCDGGHYDVHWLETLADAAGAEPKFTLGDLSAVLAANHTRRDSYLEFINRSQPPHRAGPDAERICAALTMLVAGHLGP